MFCRAHGSGVYTALKVGGGRLRCDQVQLFKRLPDGVLPSLAPVCEVKDYLPGWDLNRAQSAWNTADSNTISTDFNPIWSKVTLSSCTWEEPSTAVKRLIYYHSVTYQPEAMLLLSKAMMGMNSLSSGAQLLRNVSSTSKCLSQIACRTSEGMRGLAPYLALNAGPNNFWPLATICCCKH